MQEIKDQGNYACLLARKAKQNPQMTANVLEESLSDPGVNIYVNPYACKNLF